MACLKDSTWARHIINEICFVCSTEHGEQVMLPYPQPAIFDQAVSLLNNWEPLMGAGVTKIIVTAGSLSEAKSALELASHGNWYSCFVLMLVSCNCEGDVPVEYRVSDANLHVGFWPESK